jgi:hypothetical protein
MAPPEQGRSRPLMEAEAVELDLRVELRRGLWLAAGVRGVFVTIVSALD